MNPSARVFVPKFLESPKNPIFVRDNAIFSSNQETLLLNALLDDNYVEALSLIKNDTKLSNTADPCRACPGSEAAGVQSLRRTPDQIKNNQFLINKLEELLNDNKVEEIFIFLQSGIKLVFLLETTIKKLSQLFVKVIIDNQHNYINILLDNSVKIKSEELLMFEKELSLALENSLISDNAKLYPFLQQLYVKLPKDNRNEQGLSNVFVNALLQKNNKLIDFCIHENIKMINLSEEKKRLLSSILKNNLLLKNMKIVNILVGCSIILGNLTFHENESLMKILKITLIQPTENNKELLEILIHLKIQFTETYFSNIELINDFKEALLGNNISLVHNFINTGFTFRHIDAYDKSTSSLFRQVLLQKNIAMCNLFLQHDIKLNILDRQSHSLYDLLFMSFKKNDIEMSRIFTLANLLYRTYNTSKFNVGNLFLLACHFNHLEIVKFFFTEEFNKYYPDFDIGYEDDYGQTGLIMFTKNKNLEGIKFLMNHDPKRYETINKCNNSGKSALVIACEYSGFRNLEHVKDSNINHGNNDIIIYLLKNGSNLNQVTNYNTNPLSLLIERNNIEIITILINLGANLNNINNLHIYLDIVSKWNNMELYQLIYQLIDLSISNSADTTPIILRRIKHSEKNILLF